MKNGKVFLVGAGPGDDGLITLKAVNLLKNADAVIYDNLANSAFLYYCKKGAKIVYAGKIGNRHALEQSQINRLLVKYAERGLNVVRLKGGDPFLFGRGAEEMEELSKRKITAEVVPGVTSAIAVPSYAGIPVTMRNISSSLGIITGHEDPTKGKSSINWEKIATGFDTLIFLMGMENIRTIVSNLILNGRDSSCPAAVISRGTTPSQNTVTGVLGNILEKVKITGITSPAIIIVGEVVKYRKTLNWFETKPLFGRKIIVTRSRTQASVLSEKLKSEGAQVIEFPTIRISPISDKKFFAGLKNGNILYDYIVFTSQNGVEIFFENLSNARADARIFRDAKFACIGGATADKLSGYGIISDFTAKEFTAEGLLKEFRRENVKGKNILIARAEKARDVLPDGLKKMGAKTTILPIYRTLREKISSYLKNELVSGKADLIVFSSSSTVENFVKILGRKRFNKIKNTPSACIGPVTKMTAEKFGLNVAIIPERYDIPCLVENIIKYYRRKKT